MSSEEVHLDEAAAQQQENAIEEQKSVTFVGNGTEIKNSSSSVNITENETTVDTAEATRTSVSVIASTADAEAFLFPGVNQGSDVPLDVVSDVQAEQGMPVVVDKKHNSVSVKPLYVEDSVLIESVVQESAVLIVKTENEVGTEEVGLHCKSSADEHAISDNVYKVGSDSTAGIKLNEIEKTGDEVPIIGDPEESIAGTGSVEEVVTEVADESTEMYEDEIETISGVSENRSNVKEDSATIYECGDREPSGISESESGAEFHSVTQLGLKHEKTVENSIAEEKGVISQDTETFEVVEECIPEEGNEVTYLEDAADESRVSEDENPGSSSNEDQIIDEESSVDQQLENKIILQGSIDSCPDSETKNLEVLGMFDVEGDTNLTRKENGSNYEGEEEIDEEGEGEEFGGEEEEFEDGEEMGDEVEVEIEDCSDSEMEPDGGVTYIISEGMIVVEENEGSETFQEADTDDTSEEEHIVCEDELGKTTRIVIKVPSSSKSLGEAGSVTHLDQTTVSESADTADSSKPTDDCVSPTNSSIDVGSIEEKQEPENMNCRLTLPIDTNVQEVVKQTDNSKSSHLPVQQTDDTVSEENKSKNSRLKDESVPLTARSKASEIDKGSECEAIADTIAIGERTDQTLMCVAACNDDDMEQEERKQEKEVASSKLNSPRRLANESALRREDVDELSQNIDSQTTSSCENIEIIAAKSNFLKEPDVSKLEVNHGESENKLLHTDSEKESKQTVGSSRAKSAEKSSTKSSATKGETKVFKIASKGHSTLDKGHSEFAKERRSVSSSDGSRHASKHSHSSLHKHKSVSSKAEEKSLNIVKASNKHEAGSKEEKHSKIESSRKHSESKETSSRSSLSDGHVSTKGSAGHRTRSNSTSFKESIGKDKRSSSKDDDSSKKHNKSAAGSDDSTSRIKANTDSKVGLRSSRSRKSRPENSSVSRDINEFIQARKDKIKTMGTNVKPRQSERVSKATEKAIASGLISRRFKSNTPDNHEKIQENISEDHTSQRRSKRKAEPSLASKDDTPVSKRRTTRSGEALSPEDTTATSAQSLKSIRNNKSLKRKSSNTDQPIAKQAHHEDASVKDKVTEEFIANIPKMCRICGSNNDNLLNVFGPEGRTMQLAEKVHSLLPIVMKADEPLPSGVCHSCVVTLIACEKLVEKCSNIDKRLRVHFKCPADEPCENVQAVLREEPISASSPKADKPVPCSPQPLSSPVKPAHSTVREKTPTPNEKSVPSTRSSARVSAKNKLAESSIKQVDLKTKPSSQISSAQETPENTTGKPNPTQSSESEDSPPVLEAEPPQSHLPATNQEPAAQPPVLVPQPGKPVPELMPIPAEDAANASKQRFGNTYRARMKPGQWEKIERGLEAIHGEFDQDGEEASSTNIKPTPGSITEEFHIVDLEMNVEEVPQVELSEKSSTETSEFHVEIPDHMSEEESAVQQSSPKSVIDSILVDWSGDEDDIVPQEIANVTGSGRRAVSAGNSKDSMNGSVSNNQESVPKTPCLFGDDEEGDSAARPKSKGTSLQIAAPTSVIVKQESFWPEPAPGTSTSCSSEKPPSDVPWKCFVCGKRGKSLSKFLEHKKLHLNDRKLVSCLKCSESFSNMGLLKAHVKSHHGDDDEDELIDLQPRQTRRRASEKVVDVDLAPATDGLYHCSLCLSAFTSIESLCQHKLTHSKTESTDTFKCSVCRRTFSQHKDLQQHMASHQPAPPNLALFQCAKCDMKMTNQKEFIEHIESHNSEHQNFTCDLCNKVFDTKHKLRSHRSTVHKSTAYACHLCDKVCQKRITLIEHLRKHTGDNPFACPVCNKRFNRLANYKAHMTIHENARRYECPYCGKRFNRQSIQQRHIKTHTSEQSRKHRCRVCNLTFGLATEMFTHRKLHTREEVERATWEDEKLRLALTSFPCKVCQVAFNTVEEVLAHMPSHTDDERDIAAKLKNPRLECDICGKVLNSKRTFNAHRSSHIDGKPFVCKICSKGYSTSTGLNYHMLSHTGERPFPCTFCQKGYKNSTDLKVHMRQHTGEFPYKCNLCNKAFRSASSLQKHGFVHTNHRPFKCQFCNMSFKRENTKINHERIHTNDRRFKCKVCTRSFIQKGACDAHEKLHFRGGTLSYAPCDGPVGHVFDENSASTSTKSDKHDLFEDFEEDDFDEDDDDEDEYIIYEDEDGIDDGDGDEEEITGEIQNDMKSLAKGAFEEASKSSNGVDLPGTTITPVPVSLSSDAVPSVGDHSVHITIL